ncbi:MAG: spore germination protein GerW family protein [Eubacteriales bacterium]|nr:spore germination protein GerW family protein [Eubacteriales bacterium]
MSQLKQIVDVNTIVGAPVYAEGNSLVIPVSKVSFGFLAGGGEYSPSKVQKSLSEAENLPFLGTSVAGVSITPKAFLCVKAGQASVLPAEYDNTLDRLVELIPQVVSEIRQTLQSYSQKKTEEAQQ